MIDIGRAALQHPEAKPHAHDILLSMALAEVRQVVIMAGKACQFIIASLLCLCP